MAALGHLPAPGDAGSRQLEWSVQAGPNLPYSKTLRCSPSRHQGHLF